MNEKTNHHEVEVDTRIADAYMELVDTKQKVINAVAGLHYAMKASPPRRIVSIKANSILMERFNTKRQEAIDNGSWTVRDYDKAIARYTAAVETMDAAEAAYQEAAEEYEGWSRFYLVTSSRGHIHSSMNCSTCQWTTTFAWLPTVSGLTEAEAVAEHGAILCSVCFPSAPVEYTNQYELEEAAKAAESCAGSGKPGVEGGSRQGYAAGNFHTCSVCGETVGGAGYNVRKHKAIQDD